MRLFLSWNNIKKNYISNIIALTFSNLVPWRVVKTFIYISFLLPSPFNETFMREELHGIYMIQKLIYGRGNEEIGKGLLLKIYFHKKKGKCMSRDYLLYFNKLALPCTLQIIEALLYDKKKLPLLILLCYVWKFYSKVECDFCRVNKTSFLTFLIAQWKYKVHLFNNNNKN